MYNKVYVNKLVDIDIYNKYKYINFIPLMFFIDYSINLPDLIQDTVCSLKIHDSSCLLCIPVSLNPNFGVHHSSTEKSIWDAL